MLLTCPQQSPITRSIMSQDQPRSPQANSAVSSGGAFNCTAQPQQEGRQEERLGQGKQRGVLHADEITIGEALEVTAVAAGDKPVTDADAAAIRAAEARAADSIEAPSGGLSFMAQSAAAHNAMLHSKEQPVKLGDLLEDATLRLDGDKVVTREDAEAVASAEMREDGDVGPRDPRRVGAVVAKAAQFNDNSR